jgi:Autophagy protein Apg5
MNRAVGSPPWACGLGLAVGCSKHADMVATRDVQEAAYISRGSEGAAAVMQMSSAAQDDLWAAVQAGELQAYRRALSTIRLTPVQVGTSPMVC